MSNTPDIDPERLDAWMEDSLKRRDSKYARMESIIDEMLEALEITRSFVEEVTKAGGEYSYLDKTPIVADAYKILSGIESAIAKAKGEQP